MCACVRVHVCARDKQERREERSDKGGGGCHLFRTRPRYPVATPGGGSVPYGATLSRTSIEFLKLQNTKIFWYSRRVTENEVAKRKHKEREGYL